MQGDTHAGEQLLEQYHPTLDNSVQPMDLQFPSSALSALDPISGCNVSVSISTYADDLARATVCTSPDDVQAQLEAANVTYAWVPGTIGVSQMLKNKSMFHVLSASMPTITHAKILKKDRLPGKTCAACKKATEQGVTVHNALPNKEVGVGFGLCRQVLSCVSDDFGIGRMWPNFETITKQSWPQYLVNFHLIETTCSTLMVVLWFGTLCCDNFVMIWKCWEDLILASHCCTDFSGEFVPIDVSELRMQFLGLAIPRCRMISKKIFWSLSLVLCLHVHVPMMMAPFATSLSSLMFNYMHIWFIVGLAVMVNVQCMLWQLLQTPALGANTNLLRDAHQKSIL